MMTFPQAVSALDAKLPPDFVFDVSERACRRAFGAFLSAGPANSTAPLERRTVTVGNKPGTYKTFDTRGDDFEDVVRAAIDYVANLNL